MVLISRREFLARLAASGGAAALAGGVGAIFYRSGEAAQSGAALTTLADYRVAESALLPQLVVVRGPDPAVNVRAAIQALGGIGRFIGRGESVTLKPNLGFDRTPEQAGCTNPLVMAELVRLCRDAGAAEVRVGDNPCVDPRRSYSLSGVEEACRQAGAKIVYPDEEVSYKEMAVPGKRLKSWPVFTALADVKRVINVPVAKHHGLAGLTLGMKNWFGIVGGRRNQLHQDINTTIVDLALLVRPTLTVVDATRILVAHGPSGGRLDDVRRLDTIVAGTDPVAADSFAASLFGRSADDLPYIRNAEAAGLGLADWTKIRFKDLRA